MVWNAVLRRRPRFSFGTILIIRNTRPADRKFNRIVPPPDTPERARFGWTVPPRSSSFKLGGGIPGANAVVWPGLGRRSAISHPERADRSVPFGSGLDGILGSFNRCCPVGSVPGVDAATEVLAEPALGLIPFDGPGVRSESRSGNRGSGPENNHVLESSLANYLIRKYRIGGPTNSPPISELCELSLFKKTD